MTEVRVLCIPLKVIKGPLRLLFLHVSILFTMFWISVRFSIEYPIVSWKNNVFELLDEQKHAKPL